MTSNPTAAEIAADASFLVQALEAQTSLVRLIAMDDAAYRAASFLDDRMLQQPVQQAVARWDELAAAAAKTGRTDARWIFHIGHVGSTLVARLLGELPGVLAIREPRSLRDLALLPQEQRGHYASALTRLFSRSFAADQAALVKATSFVSEIAPALVPPGERALFMYATPKAYVSGILAGENTRAELTHFADFRRQRLMSRGIVLPDAGKSHAHLAAAGWACEMTALEAAARAMSDRCVLWVDFDRMLYRMADALRDVAAFFGFDADPQRIAAIAGGPLMRRYSKALEYEYSPALRRQLLDEAVRDHQGDIDSALAMLHRAAETCPLLESALRRSATES